MIPKGDQLLPQKSSWNFVKNGNFWLMYGSFIVDLSWLIMIYHDLSILINGHFTQWMVLSTCKTDILKSWGNSPPWWQVGHWELLGLNPEPWGLWMWRMIVWNTYVQTRKFASSFVGFQLFMLWIKHPFLLDLCTILLEHPNFATRLLQGFCRSNPTYIGQSIHIHSVR